MNSVGWPPNTPYACAEARRTQVADATFRENSVQQQQKQKAPLKSTEDEYLSGRIMFGKLKHIMKSKTAEPSELTQLTNQIEQIA